MTTGSIFWLVAFAVAALVFFAVATVASVRGLMDLRELLRTSDRRSRQERRP